MVQRLGILIAGGSGRRFGGSKALAAFRDRTLVERAHDVLAAVCDEVVVVAPADLPLPVPRNQRVADAIEGEGPLSALVAGLEARGHVRALVLAVDLPLFDRACARRLLDAARDEIALVPAPAGRLQPLAAVYAAEAACALRAALDRGERALVPAVRALAPRLLDDAALAALGIGPEALEDVDTPDDLARLEARAS